LETGALTNWSYWPVYRSGELLDLGFSVQGVFPVKLAIFVEFELILNISSVLCGGVVSSFAFGALECYQLDSFTLSLCH
jgi:hypothetical protein